MDCPRCKLISPATAQRCDCGYDFETKTVEKAFVTVGPKMKHTGSWIIAWFTILIIWNVARHWSQNTDENALAHLLDAIGDVTTPLEFVLSAVVVSGIFLSNRKPMADR